MPHGQFRRFALGLEGLDVDAVIEAGDHRLHGLRGVFGEILLPALQRALIHPADVRHRRRQIAPIPLAPR